MQHRGTLRAASPLFHFIMASRSESEGGAVLVTPDRPVKNGDKLG